MAATRDRALDRRGPYRLDQGDSRRISASSVVDISIQILPSLSPAMTPSSASMTSAQMVGEGRQVTMMSQASASSLGEAAAVAPRSTNDCTKAIVEVANVQVGAVAQDGAGELAADVAEADEPDLHGAQITPRESRIVVAPTSLLTVIVAN